MEENILKWNLAKTNFMQTMTKHAFFKTMSQIVLYIYELRSFYGKSNTTYMKFHWNYL